MSIKLFLQKLFLIVIGATAAAYGITLAIHAGFGGATLAIFWQGLSMTFSLTMGQVSFLTAVVMIVLSYFLDKKQIHIGTFLYQILYSPLVDLFSSIHRYSDSAVVNFFIMLAGIFIMAVGTGIYSAADFGKGSYDAMNFSLSSKTGLSISLTRIALDVTMSVTGLLLGGKIGLCTLATVFFTGPIVQKTVELLQKKYPFLKRS